LGLVRRLVERIGATLDVRSDGGTVCVVSFKVLPPFQAALDAA